MTLTPINFVFYQNLVGKAFKNLDALATLGDTHFGDTGGDLVKTVLSDPDAVKLFAAHYALAGAKLHESSLSSLLFEQEEEKTGHVLEKGVSMLQFENAQLETKLEETSCLLLSVFGPSSLKARTTDTLQKNLMT
mgnify:CR=1 FL=1